MYFSYVPQPYPSPSYTIFIIIVHIDLLNSFFKTAVSDITNLLLKTSFPKEQALRLVTKKLFVVHKNINFTFTSSENVLL